MSDNLDDGIYAVELNGEQHNLYNPDTNSAIQQLQQGLSEESTNRSNAIHGVESDIETEAQARRSADTTLQGNINTLNTTLQGNINTLNTTLQGNINTVSSNLSSEVTARQNADTTLQGNINTVSGRVSDIQDLIPSQATEQNKLADKDFVNSSIATNTANFLGTYTSLADIQAIQNPTNNDYAFLQTTDSAGNNLYKRYKYSSSQAEWLFEYELNNSEFTAGQWATINSGLTQSSVTQNITDAINALDASVVGGNGKYIKDIVEVNGIITATEETMDTTPTASSTKACTSGGIKDYVDNQIATAITQVLDTSF